MALGLNDKSPGKRSQTESADLIAGCDDSILVRAAQTLDGVAQKLNIVAFVVNDDAVIGNIIVDDNDSTDVVAGGLVKGFKNIDGQTLKAGTFIQAGKHNSRGWSSVTVTTGSIIAYYNYKIDRTA